MTSCFRRPSLSLIFLFWFGCDALMAFANWWFCVSVGVKPLSPASNIAHAVFTGLGFFCYFGVASPLLYYPHIYRDRLRMWDKVVNRPQKLKDYGQRTWRSHTIVGVWVSFLAALPRFIVEIHIVYTYGWRYVLQGVALVMTFFTTSCGFLAVWCTYLWRASKLFQTLSLNSMGQREREDYMRVYTEGPFRVVYGVDGLPIWATGVTVPSFITRSSFYHYYPDPDHDIEGVVSGRKGMGGSFHPNKHGEHHTGKAAVVRHATGMALKPLQAVDPDMPVIPANEQFFSGQGQNFQMTSLADPTGQQQQQQQPQQQPAGSPAPAAHGSFAIATPGHGSFAHSMPQQSFANVGGGGGGGGADVGGAGGGAANPVTVNPLSFPPPPPPQGGGFYGVHTPLPVATTPGRDAASSMHRRAATTPAPLPHIE
eukprot:Rhum_TRINITY_DN14336_c9_g1::Rhum_TRINITY_DN14336_c9_g1_i1::g.79559::m.79559